MKIAILGPAPPFRGGISLFALMLAQAMLELGHEIAFFNFKEQYPRLLFPAHDQYDSSYQDCGIQNYRILTPWLPQTWLCTAQAIKKYQPDILLVSWFLPFFAPAYGCVLRMVEAPRKVILAHNVNSHEKWMLAKFLLRCVFNKAHRIVVLSKSSLQDLATSHPNKLVCKAVLGFHPIYNCYPSDSLPHHNADEPILLFFGLIKPYKGLDILLKAMPSVLKEIHTAKLVIAGDVYGDSSVYSRLIAELGIQESVITHFRYITNPEVAQFFTQANLCILPYKSASQSGVIATAYSFGVPVIASDVGGLGEYIEQGRTGWLVHPNDPAALAKVIINHLQSKLDMRPEIEAYTKKYSWHSLARLILSQ